MAAPGSILVTSSIEFGQAVGFRERGEHTGAVLRIFLSLDDAIGRRAQFDADIFTSAFALLVGKSRACRQRDQRLGQRAGKPQNAAAAPRARR